jgi:predicted TIM-barrel enzyme
MLGVLSRIACRITGEETGAQADPKRLEKLRAAIDAPLLVASGLDESNCALFASADGAIVGTAEVDQSRVERLVRAFKAAAYR